MSKEDDATIGCAIASARFEVQDDDEFEEAMMHSRWSVL
jgi:hypothetical protein